MHNDVLIWLERKGLGRWPKAEVQTQYREGLFERYFNRNFIEALLAFNFSDDGLFIYNRAMKIYDERPLLCPLLERVLTPIELLKDGAFAATR